MTKKQRNKAATLIKGCWRRVGKYLGFSEDELMSFVSMEHHPEEQAQSMLEDWHSRNGKNAKVCHLVRALKNAAKRDVASKVFGDVVDEIETSDDEDSEEDGEDGDDN